MANLRISLGGRPLLDLRSYARRGPGHRDRLSPEELAHISRTVRRTPEVMVKVLSKDSNNLRSVARHLNYIGRRGELELETDEGDRLQARDAGQRLVEDWDLDLDQDRRDSPLTGGTGRAPKLVHKIMLSMPPGTPAKGMLEAARSFAREEFALKHRYALVLHTDEPHPHVHLVVKAASEQGGRLNIRKATLREWRRDFARHLRDQGVAANATERAVRGENRIQKKDGIFRANLRAASRHIAALDETAASEAQRGVHADPGRSSLLSTRREVRRGWEMVAEILRLHGQPRMADEIAQFLARMPEPRTESEQVMTRLLEQTRTTQRQASPPSR